MAFTLSGNRITQTGTDERTSGQTTILETIRGVGLLQKQGDTYILPEGNEIVVTGILKDSTGTFDLILENNTKFVCDNGGTIEIGNRTVNDGNVRYSGGGSITISPTNILGINQNYIHYKLGDDAGTDNTGKFSVYGSSLKLYALTGNNRQDIYLSELAGCKMDGARRNNSDTGDIVFRVQQGGRIDDNNFFNISVLEFHATSSNPFTSFKNNTYTDLTLGFISYSNQTVIDVDGVNVIGSSTRKGWTNEGGINFIDLLSNGNSETESSIKGSNYLVLNNTSDYGFHFAKTHDENIIVSDGSVLEDIKVEFKDVLNTEYTPTINNGEYSQVIKLLKTNQVVSTVGQVSTWTNYYPITKNVYGYLYNLKNEVFSNYDNFSTIKNGNLYVDKDTSITNTNKTQVSNYDTIDNAQELYDYAKHHLIDNYDGETEVLLTRDGNTIDLGSKDLDILPTVPPSPKPVFQLMDNGNKICILSDNFTANVVTTGTVTGSVNGSVVDSTGVVFTVNGLPSGAVIGAWKKTGQTQSANIVTSDTNGIKLENNTEYYIIADARGYNRSEPVLVNVGTQTNITITLDKIVDLNGNSIIPDTLTADQMKIAQMLVYDEPTNTARIRLFDNVATDSRWNAASKKFAFKQEDFIPFAFAIEMLQSTEAFLSHETTIKILPYVFEIAENSTLKIGQHAENKSQAGLSNTDKVDIVISKFVINRINDDDRLNTFLNKDQGDVDVANGNVTVATVTNVLTQATFNNVIESIPKINDIETKVDSTKTVVDNTKADINLIRNSTVSST